mgnify:CR=1 FL=1
MKRKIFVICGTFVIAVGIVACGSSSDLSTTAASAPTVDEVTSEAQPEEAAVGNGNEESTSENPNEKTDEDDSITIFEESPKKLLREEIWYSSADGHVLQSYRYEYDEVGRLIKCIHYSDSDEITSWREYEYNGNGRRIYSAEGCKSDGSIDTWCEYEYNENGKKIHETRGGSTGANKFSNYLCDYEYDILGNLISSTSYSSVTALTITSEYDSNENEITRTTLDRNSGKTTLCEYEYDSNGKLIKTTQTTDALTIVIQEATYDNDGNQLEEKTYNYDGSICTWHEYGYDSLGNEITHICYNSDGSIQFRYEEEYDNNGNIIKEIHYLNDDILDFVNEYQYNDDGYLASMSQKSGELLVSAEYEYDEDGNKIRETGFGCWIEYIFE